MASSEYRYSRQEEIANPRKLKPHVVILGAGASLATLPDGDPLGRQLPLMGDLIQRVGLGELLRKSGIDFEGRNFEEVYSTLSSFPKNCGLLARVERMVRDYFDDISLPDSPTIYDHLLLSLRPKDVVATFNWDPLLYDARARNGWLELPRVLFLHGNVRVAHCIRHRVVGGIGMQCPTCRRALKPSKLLYPIRKKNYSANAYVDAEWRYLRFAIKNAFTFTVFGYGAPASDVEAMSVMKEAWGSVDTRQLEQVEIIDVRPQADLRERWSAFIHTHHYTCVDDFYSSRIATHPRRTCESLAASTLDAKWADGNPIPRGLGFEALWNWLEPLIQAETALENRSAQGA